MSKKEITTAIHYRRILLLSPVFDFLGYQSEDFAVAIQHQEETLSLLIYAELFIGQISYVVSCIKDFYN